MNNVGINISVHANVVTPFSPVGKQAVGLESADAKGQVLPPVEQPDSNSRGSNGEAETDKTSAKGADTRRAIQGDGQGNSREQRQQQRQDEQLIEDLAARDREVRAHEQAHASVGGQYAGSPSFTFQRGPDGVNYAIGGEVPISLPQGGDNPKQTLAAAEQVRRAALAPADPSAQDRRVAAAAANIAREAQTRVTEQQAQEQQTEREDKADKEREAQAKEQARTDAKDKQQSRDQRLQELQAASRRTNQLGDQLVTLDNVQRNRNVGSVLDQLA